MNGNEYYRCGSEVFLKELPYCILPTCHTIEAEALGGKVVFGENGIQPRVREYAYAEVEQLLQLPEINFESGRIHKVLEECKERSQKGETVLLEVVGPLTILNGLIDIQFILKAMCKKPDVIKMIFEKLEVELLRYMLKAKNNGVTLISYADPIGITDILGPKTALWMTECFTVPFLKKVEELADESTIIVLCPKITHMLLTFQKVEFQEMDISEKLNYGQACIAMTGKIKMVGMKCIKNAHTNMKDGKIKEIKWK